MTDDDRDSFYSTLPRRYVAAGVLITDSSGRVLLVEPTYKQTWEVPGGVVEAGETAPVAARRECREELGIEVDLGPLLVVEHQTIDGRGDSVMFIYDGGELPSDVDLDLPASELRSYRFVPPADLGSVTVPRLANRLTWALAARVEASVVELDNGTRVGPSSGSRSG